MQTAVKFNLHIIEYEWTGDKSAQLVQALRHRVPLKVQELFVGNKTIAEVWESSYTDLSALGDELGERGDILLYPDKKSINEANALLDKLVDAIAILACVKSGVEIFGTRYEVRASKDDGG